mgnify:FL=1
MEYRALGNSGIQASAVALGTWVTGGGECWDGVDDAESIRAIEIALDRGVNFIDTAPAYGWGHSEEIVAKAVAGRRDQVVLATKCGIWWHDERGAFHFHLDGKDTYISQAPETIRIEIEDSLRRLKTDYIDLYQTHFPAKEPAATPVEDTMACLMDLKQQGKIRAIGVCNLDREQLADHCAKGDVAAHQFRYSMLWRDAEAEVLPYCAENNIATLTYMSLEQGLLTGKVGMDREFKEGEFRSNQDWNPWFKKVNRKKVLDMIAGWHDLTEKYDCTLAQLTIAWTAAQPGVTHVLCGTRNQNQARQNAAAGEITIEPDDLERIRKDAVALGPPE